MIFPKTQRSDMDLALTKDRFDTKQFDKETLQRLEKQEMNFLKSSDTTFSISSSVLILGLIAYLVFKK